METLVYELRKYQLPVFKKCVKALEKIGFALMVIATGLGKTIVSAFIARHFIDRGERGIFLYCENEGLAQAELTYRDIIGNNIKYCKFYGSESEKDWDADEADILFASFQSLSSSSGKWFEIFDREHFGFVIVDEAHHGQADSYREVIDYFDCKKLGMTAKVYTSRNGGKSSEYYHPNLVTVLKDKLFKEEAPEGWMTLNALAKKDDIYAGDKRVKNVVNEYRKDHPEWFRDYHVAGALREHCHPDLVNLIRLKFKDPGLAPNGWESVKKISSMPGVVGVMLKFKNLLINITHTKLNG